MEFTKVIDGSTCIGNSLSTINDNFSNISTELSAIDVLCNTFLTVNTLPIAHKVPGARGVVSVGAGLTVDSGTGVLGLEKVYTFTGGVGCDISARVYANVDNITTGIDVHGYIVSLPSPQDMWVIAHSAEEASATEWVKSASAALSPAFAPDNYDIIMVEYTTRGASHVPAVYGGEYGNVLVTGAANGNDGVFNITVYGTIFHKYPYTINVNGVNITQIAGYGFSFGSLREGTYTAIINNTHNHTVGSISFSLEGQTSPTTSSVSLATLILKK